MIFDVFALSSTPSAGCIIDHLSLKKSYHTFIASRTSTRTKGVTMGAKMITNRFFFRPPIPVKTTRILQKTPEFRKLAIMISLSELILAFFGVKQRIGGYERGEEKREERDYAATCCHALCCPVLWIYIYIYIYLFTARRL